MKTKQIRVSAELHRELKMTAALKRISLAKLVENMLTMAETRNKPTKKRSL